MRRVGLIVVALVVLGAVGFGGFRYGFQQGTTAGQATAATDRTAFEASRGSAVAVGGGGAGRGGQAGGASGAGGTQGGAQMGMTSGSQAAGMGRGGAMGTPVGAVGSAAAPRGSATGGTSRPNAANSLTGRVTMVSGPTFTVQSTADNASVNVVTGGDTLITKLVAGTTGDLKLNDFVTVQGMMTGDNTYTATALTGTSAQQLAALGNTGIISPVMSGGMAPATGAPGMGAPGGRGSFGGAAVAGRITQLNVGMLTLSTPDGMMVTVNTTPTTKIQTTRSAAIGDIQAGDNVTVLGDRTGESVTARLVTDQGQG